MKFNTIIFIGPQGSGKGTQAQLLAQKINAAEYIETGALCRDAAKQDTAFGKHIKALIDQGDLVTDEDIEHLVRDKLQTVRTDKIVIFDGLPRRIGQAVFLFKILKDLARDSVASLFVNLPREESVKRLMTRRICENCKTPAIWLGGPNQMCAKCGGKLIARADDATAEAINKRLDSYEKETMPIIDFVKQHSAFFEINGNQPISNVTADINKALEA